MVFRMFRKRKQYVRVCNRILDRYKIADVNNIERCFILLKRTNYVMGILNKNFNYLFSNKTDNGFQSIAKAHGILCEKGKLAAIQKYIEDIIDVIATQKNKNLQMQTYKEYISNHNEIGFDKNTIEFMTTDQIIRLSAILGGN